MKTVQVSGLRLDRSFLGRDCCSTLSQCLATATSSSLLTFCRHLWRAPSMLITLKGSVKFRFPLFQLCNSAAAADIPL